jgi:hypothetical protein
MGGLAVTVPPPGDVRLSAYVGMMVKKIGGDSVAWRKSAL